MMFSRFNGASTAPVGEYHGNGVSVFNGKSVFAPLKVLFVASSFKFLGGAEKNVIDLMQGLSEMGFHCHLAVLQGGPLVRRVQQAGVKILEFDLKKILSPEGIRKGLQLVSFLHQEQMDAVITYHADADIWAGLFARLARVPLLISSRRDMGYLLKNKHVRCYRFLNRFFTHFVSVSEAVKEEVARREGVPFDKITTIYNGVDLKNQRVPVNRAYQKQQLGLLPDVPVVGTIGSFRPIKGQEYFVRAAAQILEKRPEIQFLMVGSQDSDYFPRVKKLIEELGLRKNIHCLGERRDVAALLPILDVYVSSSLQEGFSNALIEAMASEVPVVAFDVGGNGEAIRQGETGLLVKSKDVDGLAKAVLSLLNNSALRVQIAWAARREVIHNFSFENMVKTTAELLMRLYQSKMARHNK